MNNYKPDESVFVSNEFLDASKLAANTTTFTIHNPELSDWRCYLFGSRPGSYAFVYTPIKGGEPNWFVRWMSKICLGCTWIKETK